MTVHTITDYSVPRPGDDLNPVKTTLDKFSSAVIELQRHDPKRMRGDRHKIASSILALHYVLDRIMEAEGEVRLQQAAE